MQQRCIELLAASGIEVSEAAAGRFRRFLELVQTWNQITGLVSAGDLEHLWDRHVADSLSLAPILLSAVGPAGSLLDIGSGGGFPGIILSIVLADWQVTLLERSDKKVGFLRTVCGALGLVNARLLHGEYPGIVREQSFSAITARAVERPNLVVRNVVRHMDSGGCFLCQLGDPAPEAERFPGMFHVEHIHDIWKEEGIRRGELYLVRRIVSRLA